MAPLAAAVSGVAALSAIASLAIYRPYFIGLAGLSLIYSFFTTFWKKYRFAPEQESNRWGREETVWSVATLVVLLAIVLPYVRGMTPGVSGLVYEGRGRVIHVESEEKKITLDHEVVSGLTFAMVMEYEAETSDLLRTLKPGDQVRFKLNPRGFELVIAEISKERRP